MPGKAKGKAKNNGSPVTIDRITRVVVRFESADGSQVLTRTCEMDPATTVIKSSSPQGRNPGNLMVQGRVLVQEDVSGGSS